MTFLSDGRRVLVVEDESTVLMLVEDMLLDLGFAGVETAMGVREALPMAEEVALDLAILDINLGDERSFPIAAALRARGVPVFFATGYGSSGLEGEWVGWTVLRKPFRVQDLAATIAKVLDP